MIRHRTLGCLFATAIALGIALPFFVLSGTGVGIDTGPLGGGPVSDAVCVPAQRPFVAEDDLQNPTSRPIRIEKFSLLDPHGLELLGVVLVPIEPHGKGYELLGVGRPYPPPASWLAYAKDAIWSDRHTLPMTMPPSRAGHSWNLVFGLERTARTGTLGGYEVEYEYQGAQYIWTGSTAVRVVSTERC